MRLKCTPFMHAARNDAALLVWHFKSRAAALGVERRELARHTQAGHMQAKKCIVHVQHKSAHNHSVVSLHLTPLLLL